MSITSLSLLAVLAFAKIAPSSLEQIYICSDCTKVRYSRWGHPRQIVEHAYVGGIEFPGENVSQGGEDDVSNWFSGGLVVQLKNGRRVYLAAGRFDAFVVVAQKLGSMTYMGSAIPLDPKRIPPTLSVKAEAAIRQEASTYIASSGDFGTVAEYCDYLFNHFMNDSYVELVELPTLQHYIASR